MPSRYHALSLPFQATSSKTACHTPLVVCPTDIDHCIRFLSHSTLHTPSSCQSSIRLPVLSQCQVLELFIMAYSPKPKEGSGLSPQLVNSSPPTQRITSKADGAAPNHLHPHNMATISNDDDRLLQRIGYTPVKSAPTSHSNKIHQLTHSGPPTSFFKMVHRLVCHFDSWSAWFRTRNFRKPNAIWWSSYCSLGVADW